MKKDNFTKNSQKIREILIVISKERAIIAYSNEEKRKELHLSEEDNHMKKRIFAVAAVVALAGVMMVGCGSKKKETEAPATEAVTEAAATEAETTEAAATEAETTEAAATEAETTEAAATEAETTEAAE